MTTPEILATATACHAAGADALHLHVRDGDGQHSLDAGRYTEALDELKFALPDLPIQITTEAAGLFDVQAQLACLLAVVPKWASISVREIYRSPDLADAVYGTCSDAGTTVQHILYGVDDLALLADWQDRGIVRPDQNDVIFVLGRYTDGQTSDPRDLQQFLSAKRAGMRWMACAFGPQEHSCLIDATRHGGDVRVGFENSLSDTEGGTHLNNAASVASLCRQIQDVS